MSSVKHMEKVDDETLWCPPVAFGKHKAEQRSMHTVFALFEVLLPLKSSQACDDVQQPTN